jgi:large subunit ribosomal protein L6
MSRVGKQPISIPSGVTITVDDSKITVNGSKGSLEQTALPGVKVTHQENQLLVERINDQALNRARHGLMRSLINNMVTGVSQGLRKNSKLTASVTVSPCRELI